jgi:hypothetical protein
MLSKKKSLIDDDIFDIVPYDEDDFTEVGSKKSISFKPFYSAIHEIFETEAIIPSTDGYVACEDAYWAYVPPIAQLFSNEQLSALSGNGNAKWVFVSFGRQNTERKNEKLTEYIESITKTYLDESDLLNGWAEEDENGDEINCGITSQFIETQSIEWLHRFYKWISEATGRSALIQTKPIFLNQEGKAAAAFDERKRPNLFLPVEGGSDYPTVNETLILNEETLEFIKKLGVGEPSLRDEINKKILPKYKDGVALNTRIDFKKFFHYYQEECPPGEAKNFIDSLKGTAFVLYRSKADETQYRGKARELYFPFEPLTRWFESKPDTKFVSFDDYIEIVGEDKKKELVEFLSVLGVQDTPRIVPKELDWRQANQLPYNWSHSTGSDEWHENQIDGCKELVELIEAEKKGELSMMLWLQLIKYIDSGILSNNCWSRDNVLYGRHDYFYYSSKSERYESSEAKRLRTLPWLMNADGVFMSAKELTRQSISPEYDTSSEEAAELFHLLGIEDDVVKTAGDDIDINSLGEQLGLSEEEQRQALLEFARKKKEEEADDILGGEDNEGAEEEAGDIEPLDGSDDTHV